MPRQARLDAPGTLHHVILRGIEKRRIVDDDKDRQNFVKRLGDLAEEAETRIYAWSLLTNHAHLRLWRFLDFSRNLKKNIDKWEALGSGLKN